MAYEALPVPDFRWPTLPPEDNPDTLDFIFLTAALNFAFTDFSNGGVFQVECDGRGYSDAEAMMFCLKRAWEAGEPLLRGDYLEQIDLSLLRQIFKGSIPIPLARERVDILNSIGRTLTRHFDGRFHNYLREAPSTVLGAGGLPLHLSRTFPSFLDATGSEATDAFFLKRAQLLCWQLHCRFGAEGLFRLQDPQHLTIFADYIVPVALRLMGVLRYHPELELRIQERRTLESGSQEEIEIRASSIWAGHLLTNAINRLRPADQQIVEAVLDTRLWLPFHTTHWPHHLTETTNY